MADEKASGAQPGDGTATSAAPPVADTRQEPETTTDELETLRERLKRTEQERDEANVRADNEAQGRAAATRQVADTHSARLSAEEQAVTAAISSSEGTIGQLEASLEAATQNGDAKLMAQCVRALSRETVRLETLNGHKFNLEQAKKAPPPQVRFNSSSEIDENDHRLQGFTPAIKEWVKRNPRFLSDRAFKDRVMKAHHAALGEGIPAESDEYFEYVEKKAGIRQAERREESDDEPLSEASRVERSPRGSSSAAAPSRGSPANGTRVNGRAPDLTDDERERAEIDYNHLDNIADRYQAYAAAREDLRKIGKIGTNGGR